jgi:hypothetical protein
MVMGSHNSTRVEQSQLVATISNARLLQVPLRFLSDSRPLSRFQGSYVSAQHDLNPYSFEIGVGRAFTGTPANGKVLQPKAARRKL